MCWRRSIVRQLGFFYPVDGWASFYSGAVVVGVGAECFDYFFVALHVFCAFLRGFVDGFSAFLCGFK